MPRNSSGNYTLPSGNPVVPNTIIETTWANPTMADLGAALTDSLDRYGRGGMLAQLKLADGTLAQPAFAFTTESSTGLLRPSTNVLAVSVGGNEAARFTTTGLTVAGILTAATLTVAGLFSALGGLTVGDSAADPFTINSNAATIPNGLAFAGNPVSITTNNQASTLALIDTGTNGAALRLTGNGAVTPTKYIRVSGGVLEFLNSAYSALLLQITDAGLVNAQNNITVLGGSNQRSIGFNFFGSPGYSLFVDGTVDGTAMAIRRNATNVMQFDSAHRVGVGGPSLSGITFDVNGCIRAKGGNLFDSSIAGVNIGISGTGGHIVMSTTGAPVDQKLSDILADAAGGLAFRLLNDGASNATNWLVVSRSGFVAQNITFPNGAIGIGSPAGAGYKLDLMPGGSIGGVTNIAGTSDTGAYTIWAGRSAINGGHVQLYGGSHATAPNRLILGNTGGPTIDINQAGFVDIARGSGFLRIGGHITRFESAEQTCPTGTTTFTMPHGGTRQPDALFMILRCKIAQHGWAVGSEIFTDSFYDSTVTYQRVADATNVTCNYMRDAGGTPNIFTPTGVFVNGITAANWRVVIKALWL
jgi:hypothetical protein